MDNLCDWFDRYQDGELNPKEQALFIQHMTDCEQCRTKDGMLYNLASALKSQPLPPTAKGPDRISAQAFRSLNSWDVLSFYWPKPATVWTAFALMLTLLSFLWTLPFNGSFSINDEYEMLMTDSDLSNPAQNILIAPTDDEIIRWLEGGGQIQ